MKYADYTQAVNGTNNTNVMTPLRVKQAIQANGGGGTSDYTALENKPKINGVTLEGDKSSSDLGISVPSVDEETIIKSPNLTAIGVKESSGNVDHFLTLTLSEYNAIANKDPNTFYNITDDTDPSAIPTKTSDLVNDSGFITSSYHDNTKVDKDSIARLDNVVSRNLANANNYLLGHINMSNGGIDEDNNWAYTKVKIKPNTQYTYQLTTTGNQEYEVAQYQSNGTYIVGNFGNWTSGKQSYTFTTSNNTDYILIAWRNDLSHSNIQVEEGSVATDYVPYLNLQENIFKDSIARVDNVVSRNLLNLYNFQSQTINGVTFTKNKDNSITINGTATQAFGVDFVKLKIKAGTYHLSLNETVQNDFYIYDYDTNTGIISNNSTVTLTQDYNNVGFDTWINSGTTFNNVTIYPQLEEGSTATSYTPYLNLEEAMQPKGVILYEGGTGGNVVLSDTPSNYNTLDIYYNVGSATLVQTVKANSAYFVLTLSEIDNSNPSNMGIVNYYKQYVVNGNTLTAAAVGRLFKYQNDTNVIQDKVDYLWVMKVIGYK